MLYPKSVYAIGSIFLVIVAFIPLFYSSILDQQKRKTIQNSTSFLDQKNAIIHRLESRVPVPEPPKMMTIVNKESMKELPFYELLQNEDKIFIFRKAKIGVIYNPHIDTVIGIVDISDSGFRPYEKMAH